MSPLEDQVKNIATYVKKFAPIDEKSLREFVQIARVRKFKKKEQFVREGDICDQLLFVHSGAFRYYLNHDGDDYTKDFCIDRVNPFCTAYTSFIRQKPTAINIEALEESEVSLWPASYILPLFDSLPWLQFARKIAEMLFMLKESREISLLKDNAEERHLKFLREFRDVNERVHQYYVASYLGITPESLSRIRKKRLQPKS